MKWSEIQTSPPPLTMPGLLEFMERWKPGSTVDLKPATPDQIAALAAHHGGIDVLPLVYREFLEVMGESVGALSLLWGTTSISALLEDLEQPNLERPNLRRFVKFGLGEDDYNGRHPDDFFDLTQPTPDGRDAVVLRIHEHLLARRSVRPDWPFACFSDFVRRLVVAQLAIPLSGDPRPVSFNFGNAPEATAQAYGIMVHLGFRITELGASVHCVPLHDTERQAIALLKGPSGTISGTRLQVRIPDLSQAEHLKALLDDYSLAAKGL